MFLITYIKKHKVTYISIVVTFLIGMLLGIFVTFKMPDEEKQKVEKYIDNTVEIIDNKKIDKQVLFREKLTENVKNIGIIWLMGCTIIASFTIYIFMVYKGIIFGYIITIVLVVLGLKDGFKFLFFSVLCNNIIILPFVFLLATSGILLYRDVIKRKINIKQQLIRHTIIMFINGISAVVASCIDAFFVSNLLYFL